MAAPEGGDGQICCRRAAVASPPAGSSGGEGVTAAAVGPPPPPLPQSGLQIWRREGTPTIRRLLLPSCHLQPLHLHAVRRHHASFPAPPLSPLPGRRRRRCYTQRKEEREREVQRNGEKREKTALSPLSVGPAGRRHISSGSAWEGR
uniref:Uncharacterized protein n=1 Tax=Oryza rufipogon TaxID=4529 RepID=A0A0E0QI41_ORYRU